MPELPVLCGAADVPWALKLVRACALVTGPRTCSVNFATGLGMTPQHKLLGLLWLHQHGVAKWPRDPLLRAQQAKAARNLGYSPDFTGAVQHFCVHPGARMIIDKVSEVSPVCAMIWAAVVQRFVPREDIAYQLKLCIAAFARAKSQGVCGRP